MLIQYSISSCWPLTAECATTYRLCEPAGKSPGWNISRKPLLANWLPYVAALASLKPSSASAIGVSSMNSCTRSMPLPWTP